MSHDQVGSWCNACHRETSHDVRLNEAESRDDDESSSRVVTTEVAIIRCRGCGTWSIRHKRSVHDRGHAPEEGIASVILEPARTWRRRPDWLSQLEADEPSIAALMDEVYRAANDGQHRLLSMGVRAVLDLVMLQVVGDIGSFEQKLGAMVQSGHLSPRQKDMLETVIDAGSAASHRGFKPARDLPEQMLVVMETIVRDHFVTNPMLQALKKQIPPRPPRRVPPLPSPA